ncbi:LigA protein [Streptomyces himastatinicus ATCC 53653]|uniref:LigA protein n=1 Tax=Streptomyces himastatinicus ATCC 53653 TaxID=457427 RepID=D9WPA9_9ACTN|nr:NAD(P)-dependent oxidoreductase [Streptomyces himastatinicus]EFL21774.1 LigA protein [Streptomyces himastatinicus ATCC 53653]
MPLILVTGVTGRVGRRFTKRLLEGARSGTEVRVLVRDEERGAPFAALGAQVAVGDLREEKDLRKAMDGAHAVVNIAAAFRGVPDEEAWAVNRDAAVALGRAAVEAGTSRFVQVSTNLTYGVSRGRPLVEDDESVPGGVLWGAYPASKAEAERELLALHRDHGLDLRIGSLSFVYGDGDPHLAEALRLGGTWAGNQRLAMVHHADVTQALLRLLRAPGGTAGGSVSGRKYNIVDDAPATMVELHQILGAPLPEGLTERTDGDTWWGCTSNRRLREELGWRPLYPTMWTAYDAGAL